MAEAVVRPEIALSWRRCEMAGVTPARDLNTTRQHDVEHGSALLRAARPVLDALVEHLDGLGFSLLLADDGARLVDVRCAEPSLEKLIVRNGAVLGQLLSEENSGTNSVATAYELRRGVAVKGEEHFLEIMKGYSCYGQPIFNRATGRVEGVLDITCEYGQDSSLLRPFLGRAVREIEDRLLESGRMAQARLLSAFQDAVAGHPRRHVLVLGEGVHLESPPVAALLEVDDRLLLTGMAEELRVGRSRSEAVVLARGTQVSVTMSHVAQAGSGVVCILEPARTELSAPARRHVDVTTHVPMTRHAPPDVATLRCARTGLAVSGEPGSGRTTVLSRIAGQDADLVVLDASRWTVGTDTQWWYALESSLETAGPLVVIEDVHFLPAFLAHRLSERLAASAAWVALTSSPLDAVDPEVRGLISRMPAQIELLPLRSYPTHVPAVLRSMLRHRGVDRPLSPAVQQVLTGLPWPGNLRELAALADELQTVMPGSRSNAEITTGELPAGYQRSGTPEHLTPLDRAEADAIRVALTAFGGNKLKAAEHLGISRTTLYKAIRRLRLAEHRT